MIPGQPWTRSRYEERSEPLVPIGEQVLACRGAPISCQLEHRAFQALSFLTHRVPRLNCDPCILQPLPKSFEIMIVKLCAFSEPIYPS